MIGRIRARVDRILAKEGSIHPCTGGVLVMSPDPDPSAKATMFFLGSNGLPAAVAKVARRSSGEAALVAEHEVLTSLWSSGAPSAALILPRPLELCRVQGHLVLITSAIPGSPMTTRYYRRGHVSDSLAVMDDFRLAASWLQLFQTRTRKEDVALGEAFAHWVDPAFERYRSEIGWGQVEESLLREVRSRADDMAGVRIPIVAVHGDYSAGNILIEDGRVTGLVDWECGQNEGLPFRDVYKFPTSYGLYLDRAGPRHRGVPGHPGRTVAAARWRRFGDWPNLGGFAYSYFGTGWFPALVQRFVLAQLQRLGLPASVNSVFFPLFLAEQAVTLEDESFREGYGAALRGLWEDRDSTWLWREAA